MRGGTLTGRAIRYVSRYGFARSDGARPGVAKVLIVVTDGISYDGVATPAYKARQKGILVYAIGVSGYDLTQLEQIASNNRTLAVVDNFNLLDSLRNTLLTGVCDAVPPVFVCVTLTTQFSIQLRNPDSSEFSSITSALIAEVSQLFTSIVGFQGATVVGYQPAPDNQVKVSIAVFVAEFAATTMKQTFVVAVSTGNLGSISVNASSAVIVQQETNSTIVSLVVQRNCSADLLNPESAMYIALVAQIESAVLSILQNIPGVVSIEVSGISCSGLYIRVTITVVVVSTSSSSLVTTVSTAVSSGNVGGLTVDPTSFISGDEALVCRTPLDIILLLDGSGSVGAYNFEKVKQFSQKLVETFDIGPSGTQIGVIQYSTRVRQEFSMNSFQSKEALSNAIDDIAYMRGGTLTGRAIRYVSRYGFARSDGARPGVAKVLIVVTDGISYDGVATPAYKARQKGILVYAIGVSGYDLTQLEQIASNNRTLAVVDNFNLLDSLRNTLLTGVCDAVPPVFVCVTLTTQFSIQLRNPDSSEFSSITSALIAEVSQLFTSIVGFQGATVVGYQPAPDNQVKVSIAVFVAEFAATTMKQTFVVAVSTGNLGSISVNASSAVIVQQETNSTIVSLVVQRNCSADLLNPESAMYIALVAQIESAVLSILQNIPGVVSIEVSGISCSGLYIRVTITVVVVSTSSSSLVTTVSTAVSSGNVGGLTVDPTSFISGDEALVCRTPLDIILLLDGSGSVGAYNFEKVKQFSQKLVETFDIGPSGTQIGVIQYSTRVRQEFSMNSFQSKEALSNAIDDIAYMRGGTRTGRAIRYVSRYGFARSDGARPGVAKVLIVVTDGISYDGVATPAYKARQKGILVYAIGVSGYDLTQLEQIASNNRTLAVVDNFNLLDSLRNTLLTGVCDAVPPVFVCVTLTTQFSIQLRNPDSSEFSSITSALIAEVSQLFTSIVGFQGATVVGYQPAPDNQVKVSIAVFVAEFAATTMKQTFVVAVSTGNLGSISVNASSAVIVQQETNSTIVSLVVQRNCSADLLNPESAMYIALVAQIESAVLSILQNIPGVVSIEVSGISCSGLYIRVTITVVVVSTSSSSLVTTVSTAVSSGNVGGLTVDPTSFISGDEALVCRTPLDIILLLDGSGSVGAYNFEKVKQFSQKLVETFDIGPSATQIGVIQYSTRVRQEFSMNSFQSKEALSNAIDDIPYMRGGTLTGRAIRYVSRYGFARSDGARPGVAKVLIVVTDGISYDGVATPAYKARQKGILVYAIGVSGYDLTQLEQIASNNRTLAVVDNFNLLDSLRNTLLTGVCDAVPPVFVCVTLTTQFSIQLRNPDSSEFSSITSALIAEVSQLFTSIVGFQGATVVGYQPAPDNQVKVSIAVFVAEFAATTMKQTFVVAVSTGNLGSISVNASSAVIVQQETNSTIVSLVVQRNCSADLLNPESAMYIALVAQIESAVLSILQNIPGVVSIEVSGISCSGLYIRVTITVVVVSTSSSSLVTTVSTAVSSGNVGGLTVDPTSFISGDEALVCRTPLDIILLLDGSGSVGAYNFEKVKQFSQKLVETFDIGPSATQIGVIQYSTRVRQEFSMNSFQSKEALSNAIDDIAYMRGGTLTGRAIRYVSRYGFARSDGARPGVAKVLIVVTDGISYDGVATPAYKARQKGILVYAIGVSGYDLTQLEQIASNNRTLAVVDNFNLLDSLRNTLLTGVCDAVPPVFVCVTLTTQFSIQLRNPDSSEFSSITSALIAEVSQLFTSIVGFQGATVVGYQPAPDNQVKVSIAVFVAEFAATTMKQTFVVAVSTGNLGSISVNASSAVIVQQETNSTIVSLVVQRNCSADLLNPESAMYIALVAQIESAVLSILQNIPGVVSIEVSGISCSGLYIRVTITVVVVSTSSSSLVTTVSTAVSSGNVGGLTVDPTSFISGDEALVCRTPLDIILLLDGSGSVGAYNFEKVKQFSQKLVETFDIGPSGTQIGVIQYSTRVRQEFSMNSFQSKEALSNAIDDIAYMRGGTLTGRAIRYVSRYGFARSDGARPGVAKVLIVVTDGISYDGVATPAYKARQKGILVYAIGVSGYDLTQLEQIASNNRTLAVVDNFNLLDSLRNTLLTGVCDAVPPVFVCVTLTTQFSIQLRNPDSSEFSSITSALIAEVSQLFTSIVGFQGATVVGYQPAPDNQVKVSIAVFVAEFAATTIKQTFVVAVSTGNLGSISVNASSAVIVQQETNSTIVSLVVQRNCSADLLNPESAMYIALVAQIESAVLSILQNIPGVVSIEVSGISCSGLYIRVTITVVVVSTSSSSLVTTVSTAVSSGNVGGLTVDPTSFISGDEALVCRTPLDIILLLDGSGSVGAYNFEKVKQFSQKLVETFDIGPSGTQIGVIQYSTRVRQEFSMNSFQSKEALSNAIDDIAYMRGGTRTGRAIRYVSRYGFARSDGARPGVAKVLIVVTDGISYDGVATPAYKARQKGILVYAIGVSGYDLTQLEQIASNNRTLAVVDNFNLLDSLRNTLLTGVCDAVPPVFVCVTLTTQFSIQLRNPDSSEFSSITSALIAEVSQLFTSIVGFQGATVVGYQPAPDNQVKVSIAVFVAEFAATTMKQTFVVAVSTGNLGSISVNASSAVIVRQETNSTIVSLVVQRNCSADLLNPESAMYIALVAQIESAVLSILQNIPGVVSIEVSGISCS
ncbi:uncharacterized protein LOC118404170 [Branchiostoma floridae]|uniref:Uncharacterized protein LOC118404170 n=2 Tax=Branchiostoma floridae TaxID=7739 RepID=A0A9J7HIV4_BRAFL|nr:uncharacterized protein LOC118404170 [Branchiostoma floridae]